MGLISILGIQTLTGYLRMLRNHCLFVRCDKGLKRLFQKYILNKLTLKKRIFGIWFKITPRIRLGGLTQDHP